MKIYNLLNKKKLFSILFVFCLASFCYIIANRVTNIPSEIVPIGDGNYEAMFYVQNTETGTMTCIGDGLINSPSEISNNSEAVANTIITAPDYSNYISNSLSIKWNTITKNDEGFRVIGEIVSSDSTPTTVAQAEFANIEELKSANLSNGDTATTKGFYTENDGGGAKYTIDNSANKLTIPNTSIQLNNGKYANLIYDNSINVKQVGAHGDGISDDTALFLSIFTNAPNNNIYIPTGTYLITETVFIPSNTTITGDGISSSLLACPGFAKGDDVLKIYNSNNIDISNIYISGNIEVNTREKGYSAIDGIHLLDIWNASNINISKCGFINNVYTGIRAIGNCSDINITSTEFINVDCGLIALGSGNINNLKIENSTFDGHKNSESISLFGTGTYTNIHIRNNIIKNKTKGHAIYSASGITKGIYITNNYLLDDCVGIYLKNASDILIENNTLDFSNCTNMNNGKGINLTSCDDVILRNNSITKTCQQGLYINGCTNVSATNNNISDCGYVNTDFHAIDLRGICSEIDLSSNSIVRTDNTLSQYSVVAHSSGTVSLNNNSFENSKVLLSKDSSDLTLLGNSVVVNNQGSNNTIKN